MSLFKEIFTALILMGSAIAAVLNTRPSTHHAIQARQTATQSCHATCHGAFASYSVLINVPYGGSSACDNTYSILEYNGGSVRDGCTISNWQCVEKNGNTQLWFNAPAQISDCLNYALEKSYPTVNSFNCPDC